MSEEGNHQGHSESNVDNQPSPANSSTPTFSSRFEPSTGAAELEMLDTRQTTVQGWERCRKYADHSHFIPASDFHDNHLPADSKDPSILNCITLMSKLTVRLRITRVCSSNNIDASREDGHVSNETLLCTGLFSYFDIHQYVSRFERNVWEEYSESFDENDLDRIREQLMLETNNQELRAFVKNCYSESLRHMCLLLFPQVKTLEPELRNPVFVRLLAFIVQQCFEMGVGELDERSLLSGQDFTDHLVASRSIDWNVDDDCIHPISSRSDDAQSDDLATNTPINISDDNITSTTAVAQTNASVGAPNHTSDDAPTNTSFDALTNTSFDLLTNITGESPTSSVDAPTCTSVAAASTTPCESTTSASVQAPTSAPVKAPTNALVNSPTSAPVKAPTNTSDESTTIMSTDALSTMSETTTITSGDVISIISDDATSSALGNATTNPSDDETSKTSDDEIFNPSDDDILSISHLPTTSTPANPSAADNEGDVRRVSPCPCPLCTGTACPQAEGYLLQVLTDRRAILDNNEAKTAVVDVIFGGEIRHVYGQSIDRVGNYCDLQCLECVTHEKDLALWIKGKSVAFNGVYKKVRSKVSSPVAVMCSYPHGHEKMISVGQWTARFSHDFGQTAPLEYVSYDYNTPTCPGCTGAPVLVLGQMAGCPKLFNEVQFHYGTRSDDLNRSGVGLAIR